MEDSFTLISSMSPKVKGNSKSFKKGPTSLALKKHFKRSSIYDKTKPTIENNSLIVIDSTTSGSTSSTNSKIKLHNKTPIEIDNLCDENVPKSTRLARTNEIINEQLDQVHKASLSERKVTEIEKWIDKVNFENIKKHTSNSAVFSELSTILGDDIPHNQDITPAYASNSTFVDLNSKRFDELFKKDKKETAEKCVYRDFKTYKSSSSSSESVNVENGPRKKVDKKNIEETKEKYNLDYVNNSLKNVYIEDSFKLNLDESLLTRLSKAKNTSLDRRDVSTSKNRPDNRCTDDIPDTDEYEKLLDDLYGFKWRDKKDHVLPSSEPRKNTIYKALDERLMNSEVKSKKSVIYKNPYLEFEKSKSNGLLKQLQTARLKSTVESPWVQRLKSICDSDSNSDDNQMATRTKLNFNEDSDSDNENNKDKSKVSKYFKYINRKKSELKISGASSSNTSQSSLSSQMPKVNRKCYSDKENVSDLSDVDVPLVERIKKKIVRNHESTTKKDSTKKVAKNDGNSLKNTAFKKDSNSIEIDCFENIQKDPILPKKSSHNAVVNTNSKSSSSSCCCSSSEDEWSSKVNNWNQNVKTKTDKRNYSFLSSLSNCVPISQCDMTARIFRNNFKEYKSQLVTKLFNLYNTHIFDNSLPTDTPLEWNDRMRGTAGYCYCKKIIRRTGATERSVRIVLSTKVLDSADRLRDTLVHEMCHAATWIVNHVSDGHGSYWKAWQVAHKAMRTFPELPPIKRCHEYVINTKYTYKCTGCGYSIGRHTKSLDIERKRCGYCYGKFEIFINKTSKKGEVKTVPVTQRKEPTGFALFVKENYSNYKRPELKHGDVMKILGQKFTDLKIQQT